MKQRALWSVVLVAGLALTGCGSATDGSGSSSGGSAGKLVVWDWKSGEASSAQLRGEGEGRLRQEAPGRHGRVRRPAVRPVLHPAGRGDPVRQGPGRHPVQRRRPDPRPGRTRSCRWTSTWPRTGSGWPAGTRSQGRQDLRRAGDPAGPPDLLQQGPLRAGRPRPGQAGHDVARSSSPTAPPSPRRPAPSASPRATRRASASSSSCRPWRRASSPRRSTTTGSPASATGTRPNVKRIFELWKETSDREAEQRRGQLHRDVQRRLRRLPVR